MTYYAVNKYMDQVRTTERKDSEERSISMYEYFDSKDEAHAFIYDRAWRALQDAKKALLVANLRLAKCAKKYPVSFQSTAAKDE